tara:strand:+ start:280 stop:888 length:609 start_codon:yes stop_codon:yes gene_type:complete
LKQKAVFIAIFTSLFILVLDQGSKIWVKTSMYIGQEFSVAGDWFYIHFTENPGMAFGWEFAGEYGKILLTLFRIAAVFGIVYYLIKIIRENQPIGLVLSIALIFAGALGNIIDSVVYGVVFDHSHHQIASFLPESGGYAKVFYGNVVDMLYFPLFSGHFPDWMWKVGGDYFLFFRPVFNVADTAISAGVISIVVFQKRFFGK